MITNRIKFQRKVLIISQFIQELLVEDNAQQHLISIEMTIFKVVLEKYLDVLSYNNNNNNNNNNK
jgi:hypothetical protein